MFSDNTTLPVSATVPKLSASCFVAMSVALVEMATPADAIPLALVAMLVALVAMFAVFASTTAVPA